MSRKPTMLTVSVLTAVGMAAAVALAGNALAGTAGNGATPAAGAGAPAGMEPAAFAAMQRDLKLTPAQARDRLAKEDRAARAQQVLRQTLGAGYAGTWLSADASTITVAVTDRAHETAVRAIGATPKLVTRSEAQLDALVGRLDAYSASVPKTVKGWYADVTSNAVVVLSATGVDPAAAAFVKASGVDPGAVRVETTTENPRTYIDVIGGNAYYMSGGGRCSVGFSVNGGFVTAGHCGRTGSRTTQPSGTFRGSSFPGNDYAWVQVDAGNTPRGLVNNYAGGTVAVAGSQEAAIGASVCRSGSTTGWRCGVIQQKNASVTYQEGTVTGLVRSNACAEPGDSGGSWLAGNQAQGVTSGGSGTCSSGNSVMYYQPVNEILQAYSLTLITSGGPSPTPTSSQTSNPGGTWAPGVTYQPGATVTYGSQTYRCLQGHTSMAGWEPPVVPALWQAI